MILIMFKMEIWMMIMMMTMEMIRIITMVTVIIMRLIVLHVMIPIMTVMILLSDNDNDHNIDNDNDTDTDGDDDEEYSRRRRRRRRRILHCLETPILHSMYIACWEFKVWGPRSVKRSRFRASGVPMIRTGRLSIPCSARSSDPRNKNKSKYCKTFHSHNLHRTLPLSIRSDTPVVLEPGLQPR